MAENLLSIVGLFNDKEGIMFPFGGYFATASGLFPEDAHKLRGQLIDHYGKSTIEGRISHTKLTFKKSYEGRSDPASYEFHLEDGAWRGEYKFENGVSGSAICKTDIFVQGLVAATGPNVDTGEWADLMVEGLLKKGLISKVPTSELKP